MDCLRIGVVLMKREEGARRRNMRASNEFPHLLLNSNMQLLERNIDL